MNILRVLSLALMLQLAMIAQAGPSENTKVAEKTATREACFSASLADIVEDLIPTVVNISTTSMVQTQGQRMVPFPKLPFGIPFLPFDEMSELGEGFPEKSKRSSLGSGFIIDPDGYIVTNHHVVEGAEEVIVKLHDETELKAKVVGSDKRADVALLKVEANHKLPYMSFGDSGEIRVGERIFAIGNPYGLGGSVTSGIISYKGRDISDRSDRSARIGEYMTDLIQIDASVNVGNSGGPVCDMGGKVIGMITVIYSPTGGSVGLAFAIPSRVIEASVAQIKKFGKARHGWIGVHIQPVTEEIAESLGMPKPVGALIATAVPNGPAARAGLKTGDVILKFDGHEIKDSRRVPRLIGDTATDKTVPVVIWRDRKQQTIQVTIGEFEAAEESGLIPGGSEGRAPEKGGEILGMELHALTRDYRDRFEIKPSVKGVVVTYVKKDSQAWGRGIRPGDVISEIDQQLVETPQQVVAKIEEAKKADKKTALLLINLSSRSEDDVLFVALRLDADKDKKNQTLK